MTTQCTYDYSSIIKARTNHMESRVKPVLNLVLKLLNLFPPQNFTISTILKYFYFMLLPYTLALDSIIFLSFNKHIKTTILIVHNIMLNAYMLLQ